MKRFIILGLVGYVWGGIGREFGIPVWFSIFIALMLGWYWNRIWIFFGGKL